MDYYAGRRRQMLGLTPTTAEKTRVNWLLIRESRGDRSRSLSAERNEAGLTVRERSVLRHLSRGLDAAQVAERLELSENTVRTYLKRAQEKLGANSQLHAEGWPSAAG